MRNLPAVTTGVLRRTPQWRMVIAAAAALLALAGLVLPGELPPAAAPASLARTLPPDAVALRVPHAWLAATPPRLLEGDRVDVLAARPGDRGGAIVVASEVRVLEGSDEALVIELASDDAVALALARAGGYLLLVLLRGGP